MGETTTYTCYNKYKVIRNKELAYLYKLVYKRPHCGVEHVFLTAILIMNKVKIELAELQSASHIAEITVTALHGPQS